MIVVALSSAVLACGTAIGGDQIKQARCVATVIDRGSSCIVEDSCSPSSRSYACPNTGGSCDCRFDGGVTGHFGVDAGACNELQATGALADRECPAPP